MFIQLWIAVPLLKFGEGFGEGDCLGDFAGVMGDEDECGAVAGDKEVNEAAHSFLSFGIEAMKGFVEDDQGGLFDEGAGEKDEWLLSG